MYNREQLQDFGFGGGNAFEDANFRQVDGFGGGFGGGFGAGDRRRMLGKDRKIKWRGQILSEDEVRQVFEPEYTDEKRNEWLKWIDERSKQYSIEPVIVNRLPRIYFNSDGKSKDYYIYSTEYATYEVPEQLVESSVAKPVDVIMRARGRRFPLVITDPEWDNQKIIVPTDPPKTASDASEPYWLSDRPKKDVFNLMELFVSQKTDYKNFCEDLYEKYDDRDFSDSYGRDLRNTTNFNYSRWQWTNPTEEFPMPNEEIIWFDEITGELCLKLMAGRKTFGKKFERIC